MSPEALLELIDRLTSDGPHENEDDYGYVTGCEFCGVERITHAMPVIHEVDCPWIEARELLGDDHPDHLVREYGPPYRPPYGGQVFDLTLTYGTSLPFEASEMRIRRITTTTAAGERVTWGFPWPHPDDGVLRLVTYESERLAREAMAMVST